MGRGFARCGTSWTIALRICAASRRRHGQHCHGRRRKNPVEVSAEILATLRYRAEDTFNDDLYGAVITVPAYFDDAQRQATKDASSWRHQSPGALSTNPPPLPLPTGWTNASEGVWHAVRPGRRYLGYFDPAPDAGCVGGDCHGAILPLGATTTTQRWPTGWWQTGCTVQSLQTKQPFGWQRALAAKP